MLAGFGQLVFFDLMESVRYMVTVGSVYGKLTVKAPARLAPGEWICSCSCGTLRSYTEYDIELVSHCGCKLPQNTGRDHTAKSYLVNGESLTAREIELKYGVKHQTFYARIKAGWDTALAATKPALPHQPKTPRSVRPRFTVEYNGELLTPQQLFRHSKVSYTLMYYRLKAGQSAADAIKPVQRPVRTKRLFQGRRRTLTEIVALTGVNYNTLVSRLNAGIPVHLAAVPTRSARRGKKEMVKVKRRRYDKN